MGSRNLRSWLRPSLFRLCLLLLAVAWQSAPAGLAQAADDTRAELQLDRWLVLGPVSAPLPAFHGEERPSGEPVTRNDLLAATFLELSDPWPAAGDRVTWHGGRELTWRQTAAPVGFAGTARAPAVAWLVTYLEADRFLAGEIEVETSARVRVWLDGEQVAEKTEPDGTEAEPTEPSGVGEGTRGARERDDAESAEQTGSATARIHLTPGKHRVWVKVLMEATAVAETTVSARLTVDADRRQAVTVDASPRRALGLDDLLEVDTVSGLSVSDEGELVALELAYPAVPSDRRRSWVEIRRTADGAPVRAFRGAPEVSGFTWGPGRRFAYVSRKDERATVWVGRLDDTEAEELRALLRDVEHLGAVHFTPDGTSLIYEVSEEPGKDEDGVQRMRSLQDRWSGWRTKTYLHQVSLADGARRRLTAGELSTELADISPDGSRLLFGRTRYDTEQRPFSVTELWELALDDPPSGEALAPRLLAEVTWMNGARYSPDGETILVRAGPSGFGELGRNVPEGRIANEYDGQLYLLDRHSARARAVSRDFDPSIRDAVWSRADGHIYLQAEDGSFVRLYRYRVEDGTFESLASGVDVVDDFALAARAPTLVYRGSSVTTPPRVMALEVTAPEPRRLVAPAEGRYGQVTFGRVEDWSFETRESSRPIQGRVYYPPDFDRIRASDPERKWPLFVYYYGGTAPTSRSFGGRYPKNWWAAHGYVVYVLQPSGSTGFGQAFSSLHVNDWGKTVAREILHGVERLLATHPFLDRDRVGCFGGSYGGFMTQRLVTESDLFAAAISHAGISSISSYWGEGWWGYLYSAVAAAGSYPWNRPDIFVDRSPLFDADRIDTPLLLLHGTADPNVPPGESEQLYTALKLLGKEVEYVKFEGEAHWILDEPKRRAWWRTILAWLDKHLKDQPEWWEYLWEGGAS